MSEPTQILPGGQVTLHLSILLEDGTEALSTFGEEPASWAEVVDTIAAPRDAGTSSTGKWMRVPSLGFTRSSASWIWP